MCCWLAACSLPRIAPGQNLATQNPATQNTTTENLRGISVVSGKIAWASGSHGTYLRSEDGGASWQAAHVPGADSLDFRDVVAFDGQTAYLLSAGPGEQSRIYKTVNSGKSWELEFTNKNPKGFFDCMAFWDGDHGIAVGDPVPSDHGASFELVTTNDGGAHWNPVSPASLPPAMDGEGAFAASGTCIAMQGKNRVWFATGGKAARVFRSTDRGKTWTATETPMVHGADSSGIFSIAFRDAKHGVIAGGDYKHPDQAGANLAFTNNGGCTWKLAAVSPAAYFSAIAFDGRHHRILATGTALSIEIRHGVARQISSQNLNALSVSRDGHAIAVGPRGLIVELAP